MEDDGVNFSWNDDDGAVVVQHQDAIAVYSNPRGDVVIRRQHRWDEDEDTVIVITRSQAPAVIKAIEKVLAEE
ncbi:hypothetical protein [Bradyrhizobium sp. STM 3561]|uniref:hypothetical protein n=1 Tax=Bradyrhizobium sp. STM 3561 TaxID=578923 RepID=UPI00388D8855